MKIKLSIKTVQQYANKPLTRNTPLIRHLITLKEVNSPILLYVELQDGKIEFTSQRYVEPEKAKRMRDRIYNKGWRRTADFGKGYDLSVLEQLKEVESVLAKRLAGGEEFAAIECLNFLISSKQKLQELKIEAERKAALPAHGISTNHELLGSW